MVNTIYYVATEKDLIPTKEDFVESIVPVVGCYR